MIGLFTVLIDDAPSTLLLRLMARFGCLRVTGTSARQKRDRNAKGEEEGVICAFDRGPMGWGRGRGRGGRVDLFGDL